MGNSVLPVRTIDRATLGDRLSTAFATRARMAALCPRSGRTSRARERSPAVGFGTRSGTLGDPCFPGGKVAAGKLSILVVDDTPSNLSLLSNVLMDDYRVRIAVDGEKALAITRSADPPDAILLDVMMPGMDGYEVCRRLKADPATRDIPVIFVTAMNEVDDETRGLELGGVDYVSKPLNPSIVKARLKTHLALSRQSRELAHLVHRLEAQAVELQQLNATLECRVAEEVGKVERLGRLKRFFSPQVVDLMLSGDADDPLKSHRREITAVFLDLRGYTAFTESSDPEEVMGVIGEYHAAMGRLVMQYGGTLEHFAGDGMMIFFNDPVVIDQPAATALRMALDMQASFAQLNAGWTKRGYQLAMGVGVAQGYATIGAIGFEGRRDYGVIGNVTNLAARLCAEARAGQILISQRVFAAVSECVRSEPAVDAVIASVA
jgi:CheY-like chemotaxis protein/class 3 adenylate cyclase